MKSRNKNDLSEKEIVQENPGRPVCICGFVGNTRNIRDHRFSCEKWKEMIRTSIKTFHENVP